ncbi:hypothetical protein [Lentzea sp. NPDC004782]|uniref:hypothetical protein n=1 Tax=Lentzea sp. NPDC004782 TaxID=3154458 RepID=UPI0033B88551
MPPSRRRPIPTPPAGGRPKVAGLHRRTAEAPEASEVAEEAVAPADQEAVEAAEVVEAAGEQEAEELKAPAAVEWTPPATKQPKPSKAAEAEPVTAKSGARPGWLLPAALFAVAVLFGGLGTFFLVKSRSVSYDAALVDSATTSAVNGQIREAVEKSFSYNFADVESTEKAARELLTGKALCQYNAVFGPVKEVAPQQKLVVTVRVVSSAVSSLKDGHATVLVFADQVTTRTTDNQSGGGTAMLRVSAVDSGGRWKIDNMEMFGATADQARQLQGC